MRTTMMMTMMVVGLASAAFAQEPSIEGRWTMTISGGAAMPIRLLPRFRVRHAPPASARQLFLHQDHRNPRAVGQRRHLATSLHIPGTTIEVFAAQRGAPSRACLNPTARAAFSAAARITRPTPRRQDRPHRPGHAGEEPAYRAPLPQAA